MTDFKLHDGTYLDNNQMYELDLFFGPVRVKIRHLDSIKEKIYFYLYEPTTVVVRDMCWNEFSLAYQRNIIRKWNPIPIVKRLPPHTFL